jgi:hypothetical protein
MGHVGGLIASVAFEGRESGGRRVGAGLAAEVPGLERDGVGLAYVRVVLGVFALVKGGPVDDDGVAFCGWGVRRYQSPGVGVLPGVGSGVAVGADGSDCSWEATLLSAASSIGGNAFPLFPARRKMPLQAFAER